MPNRLYSPAWWVWPLVAIIYCNNADIQIHTYMYMYMYSPIECILAHVLVQEFVCDILHVYSACT